MTVVWEAQPKTKATTEHIKFNVRNDEYNESHLETSSMWVKKLQAIQTTLTAYYDKSLTWCIKGEND